MRSKAFWIAVGVITASVAISSVAFVRTSQPVAAGDVNATLANAGGATCPATGKVMGTGMAESCAEVHRQALAQGKLDKSQYVGAELQLAAAVSGSQQLTPEQCREVMASLGYECSEADLKACAARIQELGYCTEMTTEECAAKLAHGLTVDGSGNPAACCLSGRTHQADAGMADAEVSAAVARTETVQSSSGKTCDWTKGSCEPDTK